MANAHYIRLVLLATSASFILFLALLLVFKLLAMVDPKDAAAIELSSRVFGVTFTNDTSAEIIVQMRILCNDATVCGWGTMRDGNLKPRASLKLIAISGGEMDYRIIDTSGHALGCLPLRFNADLSLRDVQNVTIEASNVSPCVNNAPSKVRFFAWSAGQASVNRSRSRLVSIAAGW